MITSEMLRDELADLDREIAQLEPKKKRHALITELLKLYPDMGPDLIPTARTVSPSGRFAGLGTTEAIFAFLKEKPEQFFTPREISEGLIAGGLIPFSKHFATSVSTACGRKSLDGGPLESIGSDSGKAYRIRQTSPSTN